MELSGSSYNADRKSGAGIMNRPMALRFLTVLTFTIAPVAVLGQSNLDPGRLPKSTVFYVAWHGTPLPDVRKTNSLLSLWDDADFAPVRAAMIEQMMQGSASSQKTQAPMTREELTQYASLLDNEFVAGYISDPNSKKTKTGTPDAQASKW